MTFDGRTATTLAMLILFAGACAMAWVLPSQAAFMPLLVGIPGALLCLAQLVIDLRRPRETPARRATEGDEDQGQSELQAFAWLAVFAGGLLGFGFIVGAPLIVTAFVRFSSRERWSTAIFAGAGTFAVMYGIFIWLLELSLFQGLILEWLF